VAPSENRLAVSTYFVLAVMILFEILSFITSLNMLGLEMVRPAYCWFIWWLNLADIYVNIAVFIYLFNGVKSAIPLLMFMAWFDMIMPFFIYVFELKTGWGFKYQTDPGRGAEILGFLLTVLVNVFLIYYFSRRDVQESFE
jgi:hypothetical protein